MVIILHSVPGPLDNLLGKVSSSVLPTVLTLENGLVAIVVSDFDLFVPEVDVPKLRRPRALNFYIFFCQPTSYFGVQELNGAF